MGAGFATRTRAVIEKLPNRSPTCCRISRPRHCARRVPASSRPNGCCCAGRDKRGPAFLIKTSFAPGGGVGVDWGEPDAPELGYWLGVEHWGQGFGTEAARAAIDFTFEEFEVEHLMSGARVTNPSSRNVLEKCGFQW